MNHKGRAQWLAAITIYGGGDIITTVIGLEYGAVEFNTVPQQILSQSGIEGLIMGKLIVLLLLFLLYKRAEHHEWVIPTCLIAMGVAIVTWNTYIILQL